MIKIKSTLILLLFFSSISFAQKSDQVLGKYHLPNDLDVQIYKSNNKYFGKIIRLNNFEDGQTTDINNPDRTKRNQKLIGKVIIKNLEYDADDNEWVNGSMYGPEKGMVFDLKVTEIRAKEIVVVGSKYIMWRTLEWTKIND